MNPYWSSYLIGRLLSVLNWGSRVHVERRTPDGHIISDTQYRNGRKIR